MSTRNTATSGGAHGVLAALALLCGTHTAWAQGDFLDTLGELCEQPTYRVTTNEEGGDPTGIGHLSNGALCHESEPCTLRAALNTAEICKDDGPKTVVLAADGPYVLTRRNEPHPALSAPSRVEVSRAGPVGLPHIFGNVLILGNDQEIVADFSEAEIVEFECSEYQYGCYDAGLFRFFHVVAGGELWLADVTLRHGYAYTVVGGIEYNDPSKCIYGTPKLWCDGGAVLNEGTFIANNTHFTENAAGDGRGGAVANHQRDPFPAFAGFDGSRFTWNYSSDVNAIVNYGGEIIVHDTLFTDNLLEYPSGINNAVIYSEGGTTELVDTTVRDNDGGAVHQYEGALQMTSSLLTGNTGNIIVNVVSATGIIDASTITGNVATPDLSDPFEPWFGLMVMCVGSELAITDTTIADNFADGLATLTDFGTCNGELSNVFIGLTGGGGPDCDIGSGLAEGALSADSDGSCGLSYLFDTPGLGALTDNGGPTETRLPTSDSPLVDAGSGCLVTDQRGSLRHDGQCDLGAVERHASD